MSKQSKNSPIIMANFSDGWTDNAAVEWISSNRQTLLWGVAALFALLILAYRMLSTSTLNSEADYFRAQALFTQFQEKSNEDGTDLKDLESILTKYPDLQAKYDGAIAQTLLIDGNLPKAQLFADWTFNRTRPDHLTFFEAYSKNSLAIGKGDYQAALQQAYDLKARMETETNTLIESTLYAYNLVRIAILNQQLRKTEAELQAWTAVQNLNADSKAAQLTNELFTTGSASLNNYIVERKKNLK